MSVKTEVVDAIARRMEWAVCYGYVSDAQGEYRYVENWHELARVALATLGDLLNEPED